MLDEANNLHLNIKLVRQLSTSVSFLDLLTENKNSVLATSVCHKETAEPYVVPFKSDHPRHIFTNIINGALMRAMRYSSTLATFNEEQRLTKLMLLYSGFVFVGIDLLECLTISFPPIVIHQDTSTIDS